jgi:predicted amidohydrolase
MNHKRRQLLTSLPLGMAGGILTAGSTGQPTPAARNPRSEVWVGTVSQEGLHLGSKEEMIEVVMSYLEAMKAYRPDIICLPETFTSVYSAAGKPSFGESAEPAPYASLMPFIKYASENKCYLICPIIIEENKKAFNAAVLIDRQGKIIGDYKKAHTTEGEMDQGVFPGPIDPPVFDLDFGRIGIQICFDIQWRDGWDALGKKAPDIIFWPSAFSGRTLIQTKAWQCQAHTVSSTIKGPARICDISGEVLAQTEFWNRNWICAPINLEKALIHTWPFNSQFVHIKNKYGRKIKITTYDQEEWTVLESRDPEIKIKEVLAEFDIPTFADRLATADIAQNDKRV